MILTLAVSGYRSLRDIVVPLTQLTVVTGANGTGKSSFYKALRLLGDIGQGRIVSSLALEGGLPSTIWAGPEEITRRMRKGEVPVQGTVRKSTVALKLGFASEDYGYAVDLGLPQAGRTLFGLDPEIKCEAVWAGEALKRTNCFAERRGPVVSVLDDAGQRQVVLRELPVFDSMLTHSADPSTTPELLSLRDRMRGWRFYDHFRTDPDAPARRAQVGTRTPILASDGADIAAALQTIIEIGDRPALDAAIDDAFKGACIEIEAEQGTFVLRMYQEGLLRPLSLAELSDGTLRYLLLVAALLSPRPPELLVLNEPETSLHPDLLAPLARLIMRASEDAQIIVVSHARAMVEELADATDASELNLEKNLGETQVLDHHGDEILRPTWSWPKR